MSSIVTFMLRNAPGF